MKRRTLKNPSGKFSIYDLSANGYGGTLLDRDLSWDTATTKATRIEQSRFPKNPGRILVANAEDGTVFWSYGKKLDGMNAGDLGLFYVPQNPLTAVMWVTAGALGTIALGSLVKRA